MKVGVVSDVHNNIEALSYALSQLRGCELILNLGDLVSQYRVLPETLRLARDHRLLGIVGNHEKAILLPAAAPLRERLSPCDLAYLQELPDQRTLELDGRRMRVVHGAPWDSPRDISCAYVYEADDKLAAAAEADVLLLGHTHIAALSLLGGVLVVNPGSCGEARDRFARLSYAELDFGAGCATVWQVRKSSAPEPMLQLAF
jgi:putative phosphoesterase